MEEMYTFLESQRLLVLASQGEDLWVSNVFYGLGEKGKLYFISGEETKHSEQILKNSDVAFSVAWYNSNDHTDRKAVQGQGMCSLATSDEDIAIGVALHNTYYPEFAERITVDWVKSDENKSHVWVIEPTMMKYWDDALYGDGGTKTFTF